MWYLERHNLISPVQNGFRKNRSTVDHIVLFESYLREAFVRLSHTVAIFFDIEKAYDTTWKHGILRAGSWSLRALRLESDCGPLDVLCCFGTGQRL